MRKVIDKPMEIIGKTEDQLDFGESSDKPKRF